jgi:excinuclease ABC subunit B
MRSIEDLQRAVAPFKVESDFAPSGDQPQAIDELEQRITTGEQHVVLLGATGTGKTATIAWLAERLAAADPGDAAEQDAGSSVRQ